MPAVDPLKVEKKSEEDKRHCVCTFLRKLPKEMVIQPEIPFLKLIVEQSPALAIEPASSPD